MLFYQETFIYDILFQLSRQSSEKFLVIPFESKQLDFSVFYF